ncbi:hypothetical protein ACFFMR_02700 [Micromonospora andamanensis]|uniref:hypothetical protein n=1 Tax=Micromonospora andamanensis TaxID=1287068 RepID=UPI00194E7B5C|nr:hypothetical protein [Micromonospora andamanensis]
MSYPMLALLPGGEALVVCPRRPWTGEGWNPHNAHVFAADGAHVRTLILGDNIVGLTVDDEGGIWTAHGEEGWKSVGGSGLVRWAAGGARLWGSGIACDEGAVNATRSAAWSFSGPTELTRVVASEQERYGSPLHDVHAIAFDGNRLLLAGAEHPGGRVDQLYRALLADGAVLRVDRVQVVDPAGRPLDSTIIASHGSRLYLHDHRDGFHVLDISM